jgi:hypothetical protein
LIKYIKYNHILNFAENVKDEFVNKLTTFRLIAVNGKMTTTKNIIKLKSLEYSCFRVCNVDAQIID